MKRVRKAETQSCHKFHPQHDVPQSLDLLFEKEINCAPQQTYQIVRLTAERLDLIASGFEDQQDLYLQDLQCCGTMRKGHERAYMQIHPSQNLVQKQPFI